MESTIDNSDLAIIMLMVAVYVVILYKFFFNIGWIQFIENNIHIVPAIIGLMLQFNFYFKRTALKIDKLISPIVKRMTLNSIARSPVVIPALTIMSLTVKRTCSTTVAAINFVVKKPYICIPMFYALASIDCTLLFNLSYSSRTVEAACLSLMILTATLNHINFARGLICIVTSIFGIAPFVITGMLFGASIYHDAVIIIAISFVILNVCFGVLRDIHSHEIVFIAVALSIATFTHDLVLSFVGIPNFVTQLLSYLHMEVLLIYILTYQFMYLLIENHISYLLI